MFLVAALNDLNINMSNIGNTYTNTERILYQNRATGMTTIWS